MITRSVSILLNQHHHIICCLNPGYGYFCTYMNIEALSSSSLSLIQSIIAKTQTDQCQSVDYLFVQVSHIMISHPSNVSQGPENIPLKQFDSFVISNIRVNWTQIEVVYGFCSRLLNFELLGFGKYLVRRIQTKHFLGLINYEGEL